MFGVLQDVTKRKQAENDLKISENRLKNIIESTTNLFYSSTLIKTEPSLLMEIEPLAVTAGEYGPQV